MVTSIYPNIATANSQVTITGNNFATSCAFYVGNSFLGGACNIVSATSVVAIVPILTGALLDVSVISNGEGQFLRSAFSYPPSLLSVEPSTLYKTSSRLTIYGNNFASPCESATLVAGIYNTTYNTTANCLVLSTGIGGNALILTFVPVVWPMLDRYTIPVLVTATINSVPTARSFSIWVLTSYAPPNSSAPVPPASSQTPNYNNVSGSTLAAVILGSVFGFLALSLVFAAWQKKLYCLNNYKHRLQRSDSVLIERQPAYAPAVQPVGPIQLQFAGPNSIERQMASAPPRDTVTGPNSIERQMASAPPSDTVERQWAGYMAEYDVRQQQHMGGVAAYDLPQRFASAAPMEVSFQQMAIASPSDTFARQYGPPASNPLYAYNQAVAFDQA